MSITKISRYCKNILAQFNVIVIDIVIYYPLIKSDLFRKAIDYARSVNGIVIPKADVNIMLQCRKSFLFCEGVPWVKLSQENFDVPQGCYDGTEVCEIVGLYLLDNSHKQKIRCLKFKT